MIKVAINGFGRIGRLAFRQIVTQTDFDIVAINDWGELGIDLVLECTGKFTAKEDAMKHISAGAKKVLISAPGKGEMKTVVYGVNDNVLTNEDVIVSAASCTTNCLAPVLNIIHKNIGIKKGFMTTVHAYTNDQATLDIAHKKGIKSRRGRACAQNIVPSSTGAAKAIGLVIPELLGKLDGNALRVPTADGSVVDLTLELSRNTSVEEINKLFQDNQNETIKFTLDPIVSSDCLGKKVGAIVDGLSTSIVEAEGAQLVKVLAWYDNEYGYTAQMLRTAKKMFQ